MAKTEDQREAEALKLAVRESDGEELTALEKREIAWLKNLWFERSAANIPKKTYLKLADRQQTQLDRQAEAFGLPMTGKHVSLFDAVKSLHDFVSNHAQKVKHHDDLNAAKKSAESRMIEIKIKRAELDLQERMDQLIARDIVRDQLAWLASQFAAMAEEVGRNHGAGPQQSINSFLDIMRREIEGGRLET